MSAINSTDSLDSFINSTIENTDTDPVTSWETRLLDRWQHLSVLSIGSVLCILIFCISIFSKHITGDYKWFVLNQALANFFFAIGNILSTVVVFVVCEPYEYNRLQYSKDPPLWFYIHREATDILITRFGFYGHLTTLLATVFNRWMAIVMPAHYQKFMSARLIVLYCILCYLVTLPSDLRLWKMLTTSYVPSLLVDIGYFLTPWLLSIILSAIVLFKLWNHMRTTTTITDEEMLKESRMVLYSLMFQIAVVFLERIPYLVNVIAIDLWLVDLIAWEDLVNGSYLEISVNIYSVISRYTCAYTCIIILITMRPYSRAVLSLISPITKFCRHHLKPNVTSKITDNNREAPKPTVVNIRSDVVNVQPAGRANSL